MDRKVRLREEEEDAETSASNWQSALGISPPAKKRQKGSHDQGMAQVASLVRTGVVEEESKYSGPAEETKSSALSFGRTHVRRWDEGELEVPADGNLSVLEQSRPARFMSARDYEKYLNAPDAATEEEEEESKDDVKEHKEPPPPKQARTGGVAMEFDEEAEEIENDSNLWSMLGELSTRSRDKDKKYTRTLDPAQRSAREAAAARADCSLAEDLERLQICHKFAEASEPTRIMTRLEQYVNKPANRVCQGELRFQRIFDDGYEVAVKNHVPLSPMQQNFYEMNLVACAPLIYDTDWFSCKDDFLARFGLVKIHLLVAGMTPRQFGKTTVVAIVVVVLSLHMNKIEIAVFAVGLDAAQRMLLRFKEYMRNYLGDQAYLRIGKDSRSEITVVTAEASLICRSTQDRIKSPDRVLVKSLPATATEDLASGFKRYAVICVLGRPFGG